MELEGGLLSWAGRAGRAELEMANGLELAGLSLLGCVAWAAVLAGGWLG